MLNELYDSQQQILEEYRAGRKLTVHVLTGEEQRELFGHNFPKALSQEDRSVIYIAKKIGDATVLSSDKPVRAYARKLSIEYHGMLWILDQLVEQGLLSRSEAVVKIKALITFNITFRNNEELQGEISKRIKLWSK